MPIALVTRLHPALRDNAGRVAARNGGREGFTLIELIIVIGIIAIIVGAVFVAMDPTRRIGESRDTTRASDVASIAQAAVIALAEGNALRDDAQCEGNPCYGDQCYVADCSVASCPTGSACVDMGSPGNPNFRCNPLIPCSVVGSAWHMIGTGEDCADACGGGSFTFGEVAAEDYFMGNQPVSIAMWFKAEANGGDLFSAMSSDDLHGFRIAVLANRISFIIFDGTERLELLSEEPISVGAQATYHHLALVFTPPPSPASPIDLTHATLYIDGNELAWDDQIDKSLPSAPSQVATELRVGGRPTSLFLGSIADLRLYFGALSASQAQSLAQGNDISLELPTPPPLAVHLPLDEGVGSVTVSSTEGLITDVTGTLDGAALWTTDQPTELGDGFAVEFQGSTPSTCIDLTSPLFASGQLNEIPVNIAAQGAEPTAEKTYYAIRRAGGSIAVKSCLAEGIDETTGFPRIIETGR